MILISIDTLRGDHLGCHGYARDTTPHIDAIADEGILFANAISQSAWTTPAHASMLSGLTPKEHGLVYYPSPGTLDPSVRTLAEVLSDRNYRTAGFHGGGYVDARFGLDQGFDVYRSVSRSFAQNVPAAQTWLESVGDDPFFLFLHGYDVHRPYRHTEDNTFFKPDVDYDIEQFCASEPYKKRPTDDVLKYIIAQYDAGIVFADRLLGRFFRDLRRRELLEKTILVITSDHGDEFFEHGDCDHIHSVHRELVHVPLIFRLPSKRTLRVDDPVAASSSIAPTILALLGIEEDGIDSSRALTPYFAGGPRPERLSIESETGIYKPESKHRDRVMYWKAVTQGPWKLTYDFAAPDEVFELFHWREDPSEHNNVADQRPQRVREMQQTLFPGEDHPGAPVPPALSGASLTEDAELVKQLRSLGYLQ